MENFGNNTKKLSKKIIILGIISGIFVGFINGFFGGGGGMIVVPVLYYIFKMPEKISHATALFIILPLSIASSIIYIIKGGVLSLNLLYSGIGFIVGGIMGALLLKKLNNKVLRVIFAFIMLVAGIKLLF